MPSACPASPLRTTYANGKLSTEPDVEIARPAEGEDEEMLELIDISSLRQRTRQTDFQDPAALRSFVERRLKRELTPRSGLPLKLGLEGFILRSSLHGRQHEVHIEPQRAEILAHFHRDLRSRGIRPGPSIYMLVIDSASRAAFEAYCPRTWAYLQGAAASQDWRLFDFPRFHAKYGSTIENMLPGVSGVHFDETLGSARRSSWQCDAIRGDVADERLLWNLLKKRGYVTAFGASGCNGLLGTRHCMHWLNQFHHVSPSLELDSNCWSQNEWSQARTASGPGGGCIGSKRPHEHLLRYFQRFFEIYSDAPAFAYLHLETAHEHIEALQLLDAPLEAHLRSLSELRRGRRRPIIILAGDHGPVKRCDGKSPLMYFMVPRQLTVKDKRWRRHADILERNRFVVSAWYDVYATIRHLVEGQNPRGAAQAPPAWDLPGHVTRSLLSPLPSNRSCPEAGIPEWFCGCSQQWVTWCPISNAGIANTMAEFLDTVNVGFDKELSRGDVPRTACPFMELQRIESCETLYSDAQRIQAKDLSGAGDAILRIRFWSTRAMLYEVYSDMVFRETPPEAGGLQALQRRSFGFRAISEYRRHEACTPPGFDPALCACGSSSS